MVPTFRVSLRRKQKQLTHPDMSSSTKALALLSTSALAAGAARGAVLYTPVNITLSQNGALSLDLNQDGTPDFELGFNASLAAKPYINNTPTGPTASYVLSSSANLGLPLTPAGTMIDGSYQSTQATGYFNQDNNANTVGGWTAAGDNEGYVGLELQDGAGTYYGWAHLIYDSTNTPPNNNDTGTLRLVDAALETTPGVGILAGQTAETGGPDIVVPPASQTGYLGGSAQLTVIATGFPAPSFQWRAGAVGSGVYTNLPGGAGVSDGAINTLTLRNLKAFNTADYVVVVANSHGSVTSAVPAKLSVLAATDSPATLVHRYSFQDLAGSSSFADSVGGSAWNGTVQGDATLTGSSLMLDGAYGCYAWLPPYITAGYTQMTVEFWADIDGANPPWTRVFAFGDSDGSQKTSGVDYCPYAPSGYQNLDFASDFDTYANNDTALTNTAGDHVTVIVDSVNGALCYYNGTNVVSTLHGAVPSLADISDPSNLLGASLVPADPYLIGTIYEFRIYEGVLSPKAVALNDAVGPANYIELSAYPMLSAQRSGSHLVLSWPAADYGFSVQAKPGLSGGTWASLTNVPALMGTHWQVSLPVSGSAQFFRLVQ